MQVAITLYRWNGRTMVHGEPMTVEAVDVRAAMEWHSREAFGKSADAFGHAYQNGKYTINYPGMHRFDWIEFAEATPVARASQGA